eukprot:m.383762 g.383762  ORF g.383762 m.383762 type:complete len:151 (-) comp56258_c0_seq59:1602-2054(-)
MECLITESTIKARITQLQEYRRHRIKRLQDAAHFEAERQARDSTKRRGASASLATNPPALTKKKSKDPTTSGRSSVDEASGLLTPAEQEFCRTIGLTFKAFSNAKCIIVINLVAQQADFSQVLSLLEGDHVKLRQLQDFLKVPTTESTPV